MILHLSPQLLHFRELWGRLWDSLFVSFVISVVVEPIKPFLRALEEGRALRVGCLTVYFLFVSDCQARKQDQFVGGGCSKKTADIYYTKHFYGGQCVGVKCLPSMLKALGVKYQHWKWISGVRYSKELASWHCFVTKVNFGLFSSGFYVTGEEWVACW